MHQRRRYGPDGRVVVDAVDDPGESRRSHTVILSDQSVCRIFYYPGAARR